MIQFGYIDPQYPAFSFVVYDAHPGALTDVDEAVKVIVEEAANGGNGKQAYIASAIHKPVVAALNAAHPRRLIIINTVIDSPWRYAPVPERAEAGAPSVTDRINEPERQADCRRARCRAPGPTAEVRGATHCQYSGPDTRGTPGPAPKRSPPRLIYCTVLARSAKLPTPPWPPAMRSIWTPIFWMPFTSAVVPGLAGGICGAGLQMSVTKPSFASGM